MKIRPTFLTLSALAISILLGVSCGKSSSKSDPAPNKAQALVDNDGMTYYREYIHTCSANTTEFIKKYPAVVQAGAVQGKCKATIKRADGKIVSAVAYCDYTGGRDYIYEPAPSDTKQLADYQGDCEDSSDPEINAITGQGTFHKI